MHAHCTASTIAHIEKKKKEKMVERMNLPYHLASSSFAGAGLDLGGGAGFFLEKRATVLKVAGLEGVGADLAATLKLRGFPSISDTPRDAAAVDAAREAISGSPDRAVVVQKSKLNWCK